MIKLAVLFSGAGKTLQNLHGLFDVVAAITTNPEAEGIELALANDIPVFVIEEDEILKVLDGLEFDLTCLAGYLHKFPSPNDYWGRVLNIHPSLLPAFGGAGMYGKKVHQKVYRSGVQYTGCTVHIVDDFYDSGPIVLQRVVKIDPWDTVDDIQQKVALEERNAYPQAIRKRYDDLQRKRS